MDIFTAFIRLRRSVYHFIDTNNEDKKRETVITASQCLRVLVEQKQTGYLKNLTATERANLRGMLKDNPLVYVLQD